MESSAAIDALAALAHPGRLNVFRRLVQAGEEGVRSGAMAEAIGAPANTASNHLSTLERAGLISSRRDGRAQVYRARFDAIGELLGFLVQDCCDGRPEVCSSVAAALAQIRCEAA